MGNLEFVVSDARMFKQWMDAISNLVDEGSFSVSSKGITLRSMDPSQIAMVDFSLPKEALEKLDAGDGALMALNLADVGKVLARARGGEKLTVSLDEKSSKVILEFVGDSKRKFKMPLLDLGGVAPKEPKIPFDAHVRMKGGAVKDVLRDAGLLSSHVVLQVKEGEFVVEARGDSGDLVVELSKGSASVSEIKATAPARAMFPHEYLDDITRACPDDADLLIELKADAPVKVSYDIGPAKLAYYLAPRVENV